MNDSQEKPQPTDNNMNNILEMLHEFRNWNIEWDKYFFKNPKNVSGIQVSDLEVFAKFLSKRYKVDKIMKNLKQTQFEPKMNNKFLVQFPEQFNIRSCSIQKINKPKFSEGKWENIKMEFIDPIMPSTSQSLFNLINFLKTNINDSKILFEVKIKSLDPVDVEIEEWVINVEKVLTINFGELDYTDGKIQQPYLILKPLDCILKY